MPALDILPETDAVDLARECLYRFLSAVVTGPYDDGWFRVLDTHSQELASSAAELLRAVADPGANSLGPCELGVEDLDLAGLLANLRKPIGDLRTEHDHAFGLVIPRECPPYETEYFPSSENFARSQQMADIAGFYRAFGVEPSADRPERPDHLGLELEFMAVLFMKKRMALASAETNADATEQASVCERAERDFFRDHLAWWVPTFASGLSRKAKGGYLRALARVLAAVVPVERRRLDIPVSSGPTRPDFIERPEEQSGCASCPLNV
jgi:TorA maturation chaperone TorD